MADVQYQMTRYRQHLISETWGPTISEAEGFKHVEVFITGAKLSPLQPSWMTLELDDGRRVTGVFKNVGAGVMTLTKRHDFDKSNVEPNP